MSVSRLLAIPELSRGTKKKPAFNQDAGGRWNPQNFSYGVIWKTTP